MNNVRAMENNDHQIQQAVSMQAMIISNQIKDVVSELKLNYNTYTDLIKSTDNYLADNEDRSVEDKMMNNKFNSENFSSTESLMRDRMFSKLIDSLQKIADQPRILVIANFPEKQIFSEHGSTCPEILDE